MQNSNINKLKSNLSSLIRGENRDGRDYMVAPVVLITEGVHNNILYPADELKKFPSAWNGSPLPIFHPEVEGKPVTANSPSVIENQSVGHVFNVNFEPANEKHPARLIGEAWIDKGKLARLVSNGVRSAVELEDLLNNDKTIEVSTGLWTEDENKSGDWNGEEYSAIARNHRPDHLALLPNGVGACSAKDGCGLPRINSADEDETMINKIAKVLSALLKNDPKQPQPNKATKQNKESNPMEAKVDKLIANEATAFTADDKPSLMKLNEAQVDALDPAKKAEPKAEPPAPKTNCPCQEKKAEEPKALTAENVAQIVSETIAKTVPALVSNAVKAETGAADRAAIVDRLKANESCKVGEATLAKMDTEELANLEESLNPALYIGRGSVRGSAEPKTNTRVAPEMPKLFTKN